MYDAGHMQAYLICALLRSVKLTVNRLKILVGWVCRSLIQNLCCNWAWLLLKVVRWLLYSRCGLHRANDLRDRKSQGTIKANDLRDRKSRGTIRTPGQR